MIEAILRGIDEIPKLGSPGSLVVFEPNAYPILTGDNTRSIVFAAAEIGLGRVFATSHEAYIEAMLRAGAPHRSVLSEDEYSIALLWRNVKNWLCHGEAMGDGEPVESVEAYNTVQDIPSSVRVVSWIGTINKTELFIAQLRKYIMNGGSLICGICPWGRYSSGTVRET